MFKKTKFPEFVLEALESFTITTYKDRYERFGRFVSGNWGQGNYGCSSCEEASVEIHQKRSGRSICS